MTEQDKIKKGPATQEFVLVDEIKEGTVILKNGGLRAILMCGSRNLELESIDSQNAIISAYADFINSFDWPNQIIIHSRKLDVGPYLKTLEEKLLRDIDSCFCRNDNSSAVLFFLRKSLTKAI